MPANLTPDYRAAEKRYREAKTDEEKLEHLQEMWALIPKHKGTDKLQADIKHRISKTKEKLEQQQRHGRRSASYKVPREGAGQVVLLGAPNAGKSLLVHRLTNAPAEVAEYPFTTHVPVPGMMPYRDIWIQLVDMPPIAAEHMDTWVPEVLRAADLALIVVDVADEDPLGQVETILERLERVKVYLSGKKSDIPPERFTHKRCLLVANKMDLVEDEESLLAFAELYGKRFPVVVVSAETGRNLDRLKEKVFEALEIMRVYSKPPGKKSESGAPFAMKRGSTVLEFAEAVHKDFAQGLKFARVWGSGKFDGQQVTRDHVLQDGDVVELHI